MQLTNINYCKAKVEHIELISIMKLYFIIDKNEDQIFIRFSINPPYKCYLTIRFYLHKTHRIMQLMKNSNQRNGNCLCCYVGVSYSGNKIGEKSPEMTLNKIGRLLNY